MEVTENGSMSKSYCLTSDMASELITLEMRLFVPIYVEFFLRKWVMRPKKLMQLEARSGRLRMYIEPNLECLLH